MNNKNKKKLSRFHPLRILHLCLQDGLSFGATALILFGIYGFLTGTGVDTIGSTFKWASIAFLIGCVTGLRNI